MAYAIAFKAGRWRNVMLICVIAPFFTSFILRTIAWRQILADDGPVVRTLNALTSCPVARLTETWVAVVAGLTYNFLPFMVLPIYASLERADPRLIEAGGDLYANGFTTFRKVTLPLCMPGVIAGTLLTFIPAAGDYVNAALLGSDTSTKMIGNVIESQFFRVLGGFPVGGGALVHPDGADSRHGRDLHPHASAPRSSCDCDDDIRPRDRPRQRADPDQHADAGQALVGRHIVAIIAGFVLVYLFVPVAYTFVFSFNNYRPSPTSSGTPWASRRSSTGRTPAARPACATRWSPASRSACSPRSSPRCSAR